jgi:hypothetical protein
MGLIQSVYPNNEENEIKDDPIEITYKDTEENDKNCEVSPNEVSPNEVSPNEVFTNEVFTNEVFEEPSKFEHVSLLQQLNILINFDKLKLSQESTSILDNIREVGLDAMADYIKENVSTYDCITLTTELSTKTINPNSAELAKYQSSINSYVLKFYTEPYILTREEVLHYMWLRYGYVALRCNISHYENCEYKTKNEKSSLKFLSRVYKYTTKLVNNSLDTSNSELFTMITDFFDSKEKYFNKF